jgi:hypothetical protein
VAEVKIAHARKHEAAFTLNLARVEPALGDPLRELGAGEVFDRGLEPLEQRVLGERIVLPDARQTVHLELKLLALRRGQ